MFKYYLEKTQNIKENPPEIKAEIKEKIKSLKKQIAAGRGFQNQILYDKLGKLKHGENIKI